MQDHQVVLKTYITEIEADMDRGRLESAGIDAMITSDDCGGMRPHLAYSLGVKLLVAREDQGRAKELLGALDLPVEETSPWNCVGCTEQNEAGFDACWNCGKAR